MQLKSFRLFFPVVMMCGFIYLGFYLLKFDDFLSQFFGYANIVFFGALLLLLFIKLLINFFKASKP